MRPGSLARACIRAIERYRGWGDARGSGCRFHPSCSTYALEALRTRPVLVALWMSAWRILRCNPLVRPGTRDPLARRRAWRPRANGLATASTVLAFSGLLVVLVTAVALAQGVTGGCTATVNGGDPVTMTRDDPLVVGEGDVVRVDGVVPPSAQALPEDQVQSTTVITVAGIEGLVGYSTESHPGQGYAWGGSVNVDDYLKWGTGLYLVEGEASGNPGWSCTGSGYVKLDGNPLTKPIGQGAAAVGGIGAIGAVAASLPKRKPGGPSAEDVKQDFGRDVEELLGVAEREPLLDVGVSAGCGALIVFMAIGFMVAMPAAVVALPAPDRRRVWAHGRPVAGFFAGLLLGIGIAVLLQQYAFWPLTTLTAIVFPLVVAVLTAVRAWLGRPYRTEFRSRHDST